MITKAIFVLEHAPDLTDEMTRGSSKKLNEPKRGEDGLNQAMLSKRGEGDNLVVTFSTTGRAN